MTGIVKGAWQYACPECGYSGVLRFRGIADHGTMLDSITDEYCPGCGEHLGGFVGVGEPTITEIVEAW